jgi:hypothetical protein
VTYVRCPSIRTWSFHRPATARTPGSAAVRRSTAGSKVGGRGPVCSPLTMIWALMVSSACADRLDLADCITTVTPVTSAMPTISAAAVIAVRRGLRPELRRPRRPGSDQENNRPSPATTGRLTSGVSNATPTKVTSTPPRISSSVVLPASEYSPTPSVATPAAPTSAPDTLSLVSGRSGVATSCIAATGAIRDARSAGSTAATTVTTTPTRNALMIAAGGTPIGAICRPSTKLLKRYASPAPAPTPAARPSTAAIRPIATASVSTEPIIWRRLAPSARISASSRVRCATMIEKVFRIRNTPTNSATPAKPSSTFVRKLKPSRRPAELSSASWSPVFTTNSGPSAAAIRSRSRAGATPSSARTVIDVNCPVLPSISCCATGSVKATSWAPPMLSRLPL